MVLIEKAILKRLEEIVRVSELENIVDYESIKRKLKKYKAEKYTSRSIEVAYQTKDEEDEDIQAKRSGILSFGFNKEYIDNSINGIEYFCIYNEGIERKTQQPEPNSAKDVVASYKHSADEYVHQLAFNLTNEKKETSTVGIAIFVDGHGQDISSSNESPYLILEGFTAPKWFSKLKSKNDQDIVDVVVEEIERYVKHRMSKDKRLRFFVNVSHSQNRQQDFNLKVIKRIADKYNVQYDEEHNLTGCETLSFDDFKFTHFMRKCKDSKLSNVHYMHTWRNYKHLLLDVKKRDEKRKEGLLEGLVNNRKLQGRVLSDLETRRDYNFPRAWNESSGLVYGFECKIESEQRKVPLVYIVGSSVVTGAIIIPLLITFLSTSQPEETPAEREFTLDKILIQESGGISKHKLNLMEILRLNTGEVKVADDLIEKLRSNNMFLEYWGDVNKLKLVKVNVGSNCIFGEACQAYNDGTSITLDENSVVSSLYTEMGSRYIVIYPGPRKKLFEMYSPPADKFEVKKEDIEDLAFLINKLIGILKNKEIKQIVVPKPRMRDRW